MGVGKWVIVREAKVILLVRLENRSFEQSVCSHVRVYAVCNLPTSPSSKPAQRLPVPLHT